MNRITITTLAIMAMGACAGMRISQEPRVAKLPPTGMLVTDDSTVGTKSVPVGAIAALVADSGFARVSGHVDSARAAYKADTAKTAAFAYAATYGDTSRAAKVADSAKKLPVAGTAGTYRSVTTDAYGRVVSGKTPTTLGPGYGVSYSDTVLANHYLRKDSAQSMFGAFTVTQALTLNGGIKGAVDGSNASTGIVGEVIESKVAYAAGAALTTGVATNVTSIVLTAGDWEISGQINFSGTSITIASGTYSWGGVSTTSATFPADGTESGAGVPPMTATSSYWGICYAPKRVTVSASTTCYLVAFTQFTAGTVKAYGFIHARRVR